MQSCLSWGKTHKYSHGSALCESVNENRRVLFPRHYSASVVFVECPLCVKWRAVENTENKFLFMAQEGSGVGTLMPCSVPLHSSLSQPALRSTISSTLATSYNKHLCVLFPGVFSDFLLHRHIQLGSSWEPTLPGPTASALMAEGSRWVRVSGFLPYSVQL